MTGLLISFFLILPFQFALHPIQGVDLALIRVLAIFISIVWLVGAMIRRQLLLPSSWVTVFFTSTIFLAGFSLLFADNIVWGIRKYLFLLSFAPLFFVFSDIFQRHPRMVTVTLRVLIGSATVAAAIALMQFFSQFIFGIATTVEFWRSSVLPFFLGPVFGESAARYSSLLVNVHGTTILRASAFFPDPHIAAYFFGITGACALAFALHRKTLIWKIASATILLADLLTFSRGGYVALLALLGVFFLSSAKQSFSFSKQKQLFTILSIGIVLFALLLFVTPFGDRFRSSFMINEGSNQGRLAMWEAGTTATTTHPITGVGLGNFPLFVKPTAQYREPIYAHNLYLDIAAEAGILNSFLFTLLLVTAFWSLWKAREVSPVLLGPAGALALFMIHSLVENPLFSVHIFPILLLLLAMSTTISHTQKNLSSNT